MRPVVVVVLLSLTAAACSGGDDDASPSTTGDSTEPATTADTGAATSTTTATTTSTTSTTLSPTTSAEPDPTTTAVPTTSTPPTASLPDDPTDAELAVIRDQVIAAATEAYEVSDQVRQHPDDEDVLATMAAVMTAERIDYLMSNFVLFYRANDLVERPNPDRPAAIEFRPETFTVDPATGTASIEFCYLSSNLLVEPGGNADGSDQVHDDSFGSVLVRRDMALTDGRWLDDGGEDLVVSEGETSCTAA